MDSWRLLLLSFALLGAVALTSAEDKKECNKEKDCPWSLWNHYEAKGCKPVYEKDACCPASFDCSDYEKQKPEVDGCQFKGKTYTQGQAINTTNPCHRCICGARGVSGCAVTECFSEISQPNCIPLFDHTDCCPKNYYCLFGEKKSLDEVKDTPTCKWEGKTYVKGQIIEISDEPCTTCICTPEFKGPDSPSCKKVECTFPGNNLKMKRGCVPIYLKKRCCSIDWLCPSFNEPRPPIVKREAGPICKFGTREIPIGKSLELQDPCTTCNCTTPPDLTCIREQCKGPPDNNFARCRAIPKEGQCCPEFQCAPPGAMPFEGPGGPFPGGPPRPDQPPQPQEAPAQPQPSA